MKVELGDDAPPAIVMQFEPSDVENGAPFDLGKPSASFPKVCYLSSHPFLGSKVIVFGLATAIAFMKSLHSADAIPMHPAVMLPQ